MQTIIYAVVAYLLMLTTLRVLARRPGAQMTAFEFVLVFLIGGVSILCIMGEDRSITNSTVAVITVGLLHRLIARLKYRYKSLGLFVDGTPITLMERGQMDLDLMNRVGVHETDIMAASRSKGIKTLDDVECAVLERNGGVSIVKKSD